MKPNVKVTASKPPPTHSVMPYSRTSEPQPSPFPCPTRFVERATPSLVSPAALIVQARFQQFSPVLSMFQRAFPDLALQHCQHTCTILCANREFLRRELLRRRDAFPESSAKPRPLLPSPPPPATSLFQSLPLALLPAVWKLSAPCFPLCWLSLGSPWFTRVQLAGFFRVPFQGFQRGPLSRIQHRHTGFPMLPPARIQSAPQTVQHILKDRKRCLKIRAERHHLIAQAVHFGEVGSDRSCPPLRKIICTRTRARGIADRACHDPRIQLGYSCQHRSHGFARWPTYRQSQLAFIALNCAHAFSQVVCNFFPSTQELRRLRFCSLVPHMPFSRISRVFPQTDCLMRKCYHFLKSRKIQNNWRFWSLTSECANRGVFWRRWHYPTSMVVFGLMAHLGACTSSVRALP